MRRHLPILALLLITAGCAAKGSPTILYSLDGPPLAIAGDYGELEVTGHMERECMLGQGQIGLNIDGASCLDSIKSAPNESGHISAILRCDTGEVLMLSFRSLGPDQGIGIGRLMNAQGSVRGGPVIFYFHPWEEEARRRLEQEKDILMEIIKKREQQ